MKADHGFIAERPVARHCAALVGTHPGMDIWLARLSEAGRIAANVLGGRLAGLLGGDIPLVVCGDTAVLTQAGLAERVGELAANCLFRVGARDAPMLATVSAAAALALTDRTFGGRGDVPDSLPRQFPLSAELTLNRLEKALGVTLLTAFANGREESASDLPDSWKRDDDLRRIEGFGSDAPEDAEFATVELSVRQQGLEPWSALLATPLAAIAELFADALPTAPRRGGRSHPGAAPFSEIPLPVRAVLTSFRLPLSRVSNLQIGDRLVLSVPRCVPLSIGDTVIGRGTVGTQDDRVAIRLDDGATIQTAASHSHENGIVNYGE